MNRKPSRGRPDWRSLCQQLGEDDGVDPKEFFKASGDRRPHRKTLQLCGQVRRVLDYVLSGDSDDDLLRGLLVHEVRPAPDASRLLVVVAPADPADAVDRVQILERLTAAAPRLRCEIARSIHRRKTPQLMFDVVLPSVSSPVGEHSGQPPHTVSRPRPEDVEQ